ncbi:MAG: SPOR domain-containing protein [Bacteroidales bacterium]|nr:SPOR domain-containing protein [Bacteroidales bacterium]
MKRLVFVVVALLGLSASLKGQSVSPADTIPQVDTLVQEIYVPTVFETLGGSVVASDSLNTLMTEYLSKNPSRNVQVYRLRIFFDNKQDARAMSELVASQFSEVYPDVPVFRVYTNPYFKVTVGNFRSKSEAMKFLNKIKEDYPSVFLVKESFSTI